MRLFPLLLCLPLSVLAQDEAPQGGRGGSQDPINTGTFASLRVRNIGPTFVSGRVSQFAVFPDDSSHYLIAEASGGVWETRNDGTSWTPIFDSQGSYSIGTITIDQKNPSMTVLELLRLQVSRKRQRQLRPYQADHAPQLAQPELVAHLHQRLRLMRALHSRLGHQAHEAGQQ
ncbi:MAG: hypothetical protein ACLQU1_33200 [Bryobacteraceae bacterium]